MELLVPRIRALKGVDKPAPIVLVSRDELPSNVQGYDAHVYLVLGPNLRAVEGLVLAHELAHWFDDPVWERLPHALREGFADSTAALAYPIDASTKYTKYVFLAPNVVDRDRFRSLCDSMVTDHIVHGVDDEHLVRTVGYIAAGAIGVRGLRALCERAVNEEMSTVPADWIYDALPFDPMQPDEWRAATRRFMNEIDSAAARERAATTTAATSATAPRSK